MYIKRSIFNNVVVGSNRSSTVTCGGLATHPLGCASFAATAPVVPVIAEVHNRHAEPRRVNNHTLAVKVYLQ